MLAGGSAAAQGDFDSVAITAHPVLAAQPTAGLHERYGDPERFLTGLYSPLKSEGM